MGQFAKEAGHSQIKRLRRNSKTIVKEGGKDTWAEKRLILDPGQIKAGNVTRKDFLGGLLKNYQRAA